MHTRGSHRSSPLSFDPEIERTLRQNRVLVRENKIIGSPTSPITPRNIMADSQIPPTTSQSSSSFIPTSTQPSPNTTLPNTTAEFTPSNVTQPITTQTEPTITYNPSTTIPPLSHFFPPTTGQSSSTFTIAPNSTIVHTTSSFRPQQQQSGFQYSTIPFGQTSGIQGDGYDDGFEDYEGYEDDGYGYGGYGDQGEFGYLQSQSQGMASVGGMPQQQIIPQHIRPRPQGPPIQQPIPLQQVRPQHIQPQFQRPIQYPPMPQLPIAPQGPIPRPMGPIRPRGRLGVPRRHLREQARGIEAHFRPIITQNPSPVVIPHNNQGRTFEVRTNSLQSLPKYKGLATEEPYFHLEAYDSICNTFGSQGFSADEVKLVLFQFSLEDKAKKWFYTLPSASIYTWGEMQQTFLDEFYTAQKTNDARKGLRSFQQQHGEMFHEAFERFNMMIKNCPHHGIELWELMNAFHEGLSAEDARDLMSITGGTFGTNYENDDWEFLENMAITSKRKAQASRRARPAIARPQVHAIDDGNVQTTNQIYDVCALCNEIGHAAENCQGMLDGQYEEVHAVQGQGQGGGGRNYNNMNSNTYHPGLRNHPNFRYGNPSNQANPNFQGNQGFQRQYQTGQSFSGGNEMMEMLKAMQSEMQRMNQRDEVRMQKDEARDKSIQSLTTQMGQLASDVAMLKKAKGQLPSDTVPNPKNIKSININVVSTVPNTKFNETLLTSSYQVNAGLEKDAEVENDKEYEAPIVPIRVGKLKIPHALLDYGASVSVLPSDLYDMYDFGPLEGIDTMVSLADGSWRRPRGMVRNVKIQLGEFEYPVDFLVLDYDSTNMASQQRVILGRPFLYTANAQIDCREGIITMTEKNR
ncbi:putative transcription factor interactor and regulator CCHC(Zn) family [Helianthus annuus]|nr:putative transcription factor interactor and regulator CCHC(Zn) family [Helianthus annuus]KAJ0504933.1 putative transcription factor interactor and regulator CCHC(Zn) family [Helianthus annuus]KAJ0674623.1 putative transcription factor interactor and regulator CCHC(Zn) family [Helianthus annuus]